MRLCAVKLGSCWTVSGGWAQGLMWQRGGDDGQKRRKEGWVGPGEPSKLFSCRGLQFVPEDSFSLSRSRQIANLISLNIGIPV